VTVGGLYVEGFAAVCEVHTVAHGSARPAHKS